MTFTVKRGAGSNSTAPTLHDSAKNLPGKRLKVEHLEEDSNSIVIDSSDNMDTAIWILMWMHFSGYVLHDWQHHTKAYR